MPNRYEPDDDSRQGRNQRPGQAEQFQSRYDRDDHRSQMGEGGRGEDFDRPANTWSDDDRYGSGNRGSGAEYRQGSGARRSGYSPPRDDLESYRRDSSQAGERSSGGYGGARERDTFAPPGGSQNRGAGDDWRERNRPSQSRSPGGIPHDDSTDQDRGLLERAGNTLARWLGDDADYGRGSASHRGHGPANYTRSDERVLEDACDALTQDHWVDARNVQVTVQKGEVTLDGTVSDRDQKRRAEDCVEHLSGVKHVQNNLRVQETSGTSGSASPTTGTI